MWLTIKPIPFQYKTLLFLCVAVNVVRSIFKSPVLKNKPRRYTIKCQYINIECRCLPRKRSSTMHNPQEDIDRSECTHLQWNHIAHTQSLCGFVHTYVSINVETGNAVAKTALNEIDYRTANSNVCLIVFSKIAQRTTVKQMKFYACSVLLIPKKTNKTKVNGHICWFQLNLCISGIMRCRSDITNMHK